MDRSNRYRPHFVGAVVISLFFSSAASAQEEYCADLYQQYQLVEQPEEDTMAVYLLEQHVRCSQNDGKLLELLSLYERTNNTTRFSRKSQYLGLTDIDARSFLAFYYELKGGAEISVLLYDQLFQETSDPYFAYQQARILINEHDPELAQCYIQNGTSVLDSCNTFDEDYVWIEGTEGKQKVNLKAALYFMYACTLELINRPNDAKTYYQRALGLQGNFDAARTRYFHLGNNKIMVRQ